MTSQPQPPASVMSGCVLVLRGDAAHLPLPDQSVDLIVTSPPYFGQRDYQDGGQSLAGQIGSENTPAEYIAALVRCTREWIRVLKPTGSIFVNLGDKYSQRVAVRPSSHQDGLFPDQPELRKDWKRDRAAGLTRMPAENIINDDGDCAAEKSLMQLPQRYSIACTDQLGLILRRDNIWHKTSGMPESVADRCTTRHEYVFHLTKEKSYFSAIDEIREPHLMKPQRRPNGHKERQRLGVLPAHTWGTSKRDEMGIDGHPLGKAPGSVWEIPVAPLLVPEHIQHARCCGGRRRGGCRDGLSHHAAFPPGLARKAILGWSPSGICTKCGQGRFPVTRRETIPLRAGDTPGRSALNRDARHGADRRAGTHMASRSAITGYACACTPYTSHPATASHDRQAQEYARETGRHSHPHGGVGVLPRTGPWREYHFDRWTPAPTRPALVVDPFGGTGTTALVASALGRNAITADLSADYCHLARWRTTDPAERARALRVPKPPPARPGQDPLFDLET
jgi:DNA modification methylase